MPCPHVVGRKLRVIVVSHKPDPAEGIIRPAAAELQHDAPSVIQVRAKDTGTGLRELAGSLRLRDGARRQLDTSLTWARFTARLSTV